LLNRKAGEEVEFELDAAKKHFRIDAIEPYVAPRPASATETAVAASQ
jgi:hypothetical protein